MTELRRLSPRELLLNLRDLKGALQSGEELTPSDRDRLEQILEHLIGLSDDVFVLVYRTAVELKALKLPPIKRGLLEADLKSIPNDLSATSQRARWVRVHDAIDAATAGLAPAGGGRSGSALTGPERAAHLRARQRGTEISGRRFMRPELPDRPE